MSLFMDINQTNEEIGSLLYKIEEQFARLLQQGHQISMLETDIALRDIQKLYERFHDLRDYAANRRVRAEEPILVKEKVTEAPKLEWIAEPIKPIENDVKAVEKTELVDETKPLVNVETSKPNEAQAEAAKTEVKPIELETEQKEETVVAEKAETIVATPEPVKKEETPKPNDWQRTFEPKSNIPEQVTAPKKDLLQERERDFVPTVRKIEFKPEPITSDGGKKETLFDKAASLYDKIAKPVDKSIATQASKQPISNIKAAIGINEKFTYLKELFKNNINDYNESLEKLNNFDNYAAAEDYFQELKTKFNWDPDSKSFQGLADLMGRRYL